MLSDRTAHGRQLGRFSGRRHRWTLGMAVLAAACMVVLAEQATVFGVALLWFGFSAFQNGEYATLSAAIPDHVPVRQRATVSGWVGMPIALGLVLGTVLVVDVLDQRLVAGYVTLAVLMVLLALPFVLFTPDYPLAPHDREPFSWRRLASSYWLSPREYPDFGWAWLTRFLTSLAIAMGTLYLLYFLRDAVHYARLFPGKTAADGLLILILIYTGCVVVASIVGGVISDRRGRRKMLVTVSGLLMAAAALLLTFVETWDAALLAAVLFGLGYGAYIAVDQALITQVLPAARDRAKDLGIINIAIVCPGAIGAVIAAPLVSMAGYPALFGATAVVAVAAAIGVWKIKSVRNPARRGRARRSGGSAHQPPGRVPHHGLVRPAAADVWLAVATRGLGHRHGPAPARSARRWGPAAGGVGLTGGNASTASASRSVGSGPRGRVAASARPGRDRLSSPRWPGPATSTWLGSPPSARRATGRRHAVCPRHPAAAPTRSRVAVGGGRARHGADGRRGGIQDLASGAGWPARWPRSGRSSASSPRSARAPARVPDEVRAGRHGCGCGGVSRTPAQQGDQQHAAVHHAAVACHPA
jgi:MFS family permease